MHNIWVIWLPICNEIKRLQIRSAWVTLMSIYHVPFFIHHFSLYKMHALSHARQYKELKIVCENWTTSLTFKILGSVKYSLHVPWPPPDAETPLFSTKTCITLSAKIPAPAVSESPIAPITSMSPGLNLWTETGTSADRPPTICDPYCSKWINK